ncbi:creatine transporter [Stemphylium lycopersici]|uniref:Creatine transporter n=1 Tax=Stemphylium lycopersici TaxID=183478 RepID=A0A364N8F0_STELY|nr:creatine transporter [Stemphylium lycopersici]RAR13443.1 creatine transporter [Stemphylium lycopersici]
MNVARKVIRAMFPPPRVAPDGRAEWPSRTPYVLASMGGAMGFGNLLRFPSQVFNNNGIQWFIPYLMAIGLLAIPVLILEVAIGQAYRSGCVIAYNGLDRRFTGVGFGMVCIGYAVAIYYIPILSWVMVYFRNSFQSADNFPWNEDPQAYFDQVVNKVPAIPAEYNGGEVTRYATYPGTALDGELVGWTMFSWFIVWICLYKGIAITARVVYITIVLPIILTVVLVGRGASLPNASRGIKLYFGEFNGGQLAGGQIWQAACSQVFYSTGVGFGYYTAYASYNSKFADAVQDAIIICTSNALFESFAAFAVFGVVGFLNLQPGQGDPVGTYTLGFYTLPSAIRQMPGAPFWAVLFFLTLFLLGISSSFALLDAMITTICDTHWGRKYKHSTIATIITVISALLSIFYSTGFGYEATNAVDAWISNISLIAVVWCECVAATSFYRYVDVIGQVGAASFWIYQITYIGAMAVGNIVAHTVEDKVGAGVGFGVYILGTILSILLAKDPTVPAPKFWGRNKFSSRVWWVGLYSGHQLANDLNYVVCVGKQWRLPVFWAPILRYFAAPVLSIIFCFAYPSFYATRGDPLAIFGFAVAHLIIAVVLVGFIIPRSMNIFVPPERRDEGNRQYAPRTVLGKDDTNIVGGVAPGAEEEAGLSSVESTEKKDDKK